MRDTLVSENGTRPTSGIKDAGEDSSRGGAPIKPSFFRRLPQRRQKIPAGDAVAWSEQTAVERLSEVLADQIVARLGLFAARTQPRR